VVVEDATLLDPAYRNLILVPLTEDQRLATTDLSVGIDPTPRNGCTKRCYALSHCVATSSAKRVRHTASKIAEAEQLAIRRQIPLAIGLE
jgi:mRNA interferase MazF